MKLTIIANRAPGKATTSSNKFFVLDDLHVIETNIPDVNNRYIRVGWYFIIIIMTPGVIKLRVKIQNQMEILPKF